MAGRAGRFAEARVARQCVGIGMAGLLSMAQVEREFFQLR